MSCDPAAPWPRGRDSLQLAVGAALTAAGASFRLGGERVHPWRLAVQVAAGEPVGVWKDRVGGLGVPHVLLQPEVRDGEVDLQRGVLVRTRTLIPMARIQHVDTRRGPLERRFGLATVVLYTGEPRNSGTNNWEITKRHIDGDRELFDIFEGIRDDAENLRIALMKGDWIEVGEILKVAFPHRKRLSPMITTPHMDDLIETALSNGAIAAKVCGAGGGGCIAFFCEEGRKTGVEAALLREVGAEVLKFHISTEGLVVKVS